MIKKLAVLLFFFFTFPSSALALVCSSPKKGADTAREGALTKNQLGISTFYRYSPYSTNHTTIPMIKRCSIDVLRNNQNPGVCNYTSGTCTPDRQCSGRRACCPAESIRETVNQRGTGGYWLIFNEPEWQENYNNAQQAANDADFAIDFIKGYDPQAKFILGWYPGIQNYHNLPNRIAGWHIHTYHWHSAFWNRAAIDNYFTSFKNEILRHPAHVNWPEKELWLTEFGTLMRNGSPNCDDLSVQTGCECRFDRIDNDPSQLCVYFLEKLLGWLESAASPIDKYFWWSFGSCKQQYISGGYITGEDWERDLCFGPLTAEGGGLNNLGRAFAAIPNTNGVCWYGASPTPTPACPNRSLGNLNCDSAGLIDELDLAQLLASWTENSLTKLNNLLSNWKTK